MIRQYVAGEVMRLSLVLLLLLAPSLASAQDSSGVAEKYHTYLTVQGIGIRSLGNFREDWKMGWGGYVGYGLIFPSSRWGLVFQTGYISFVKFPSADLGPDPLCTLVPFMAGGRYYFLTESLRPFVSAMAGMNVVTQDYVRDGVRIDYALLKINSQVGAGLQIVFASELAIEVAVKYNAHNLDVSTPYNITGIEYGIALNWPFGE